MRCGIKSAFRWVPFLLIFCGLAVLAEVSLLRQTFLARYGTQTWDQLHLYGSAVLVAAAYVGQPRRYPWWRKIIVAVALVLAAGVLREVRQYYDVGPHGFSRHDMRSNLLGAAAGAALSLGGSWLWGRCRR